MSELPSVWRRGETGPPLVFLHGVGGDHSMWRPQLARFGARFRCVAWDMPGYGASPPPGSWSFATFADALLRLLDALGFARIHLVGQSLGGMIAQEFAATSADRLATLTLCNTSAAFGTMDGEFQRRFVADRLEPLERGASMEDVAAENIARIMGPGASREARAIARACTANIPAESYKQAIRMIPSFDRRESLARIACPALLIAGALDAVAPAPMMERMATKVPGARFVSLEGCGHLGSIEAPDAFDAALGDFLSALA